MLQNLLWKVFPPYEVTKTASEMRSIFDDFQPSSRPIIEPVAMGEIRNADKTVYSVRIDHMKPDHLALLVITNVIGRHLSSGMHHTYRGRLSATGHDMLGLWNKVQERLVGQGYTTDAERVEDDNWLREQIAAVG